MTTIESKIGSIYAGEEVIYNFFTDFTNFDKIIPSDKVENWQSTPDSCSFSVKEAGEITVNMIEKTPYNYIKISPSGKVPFTFNFYIQLKQIGDNDTKLKLTIKAELNPMMKMILKKPLKKGLDDIVDRLTQLPAQTFEV